MHPLKLQLRKATAEFTAEKEHYDDLLYEMKNQHPQPNGTRWLHGEVITSNRIYIAKRNMLTAEAAMMNLQAEVNIYCKK